MDIYVSEHAHICAYEFVYTCVYVCLCIHICLCLSTCMLVCVWLCTCIVCVSVSVCMYIATHPQIRPWAVWLDSEVSVCHWWFLNILREAFLTSSQGWGIKKRSSDLLQTPQQVGRLYKALIAMLILPLWGQAASLWHVGASPRPCCPALRAPIVGNKWLCAIAWDPAGDGSILKCWGRRHSREDRKGSTPHFV